MYNFLTVADNNTTSLANAFLQELYQNLKLTVLVDRPIICRYIFFAEFFFLMLGDNIGGKNHYYHVTCFCSNVITMLHGLCLWEKTSISR
jgi:hypothetical protein